MNLQALVASVVGGIMGAVVVLLLHTTPLEVPAQPPPEEAAAPRAPKTPTPTPVCQNNGQITICVWDKCSATPLPRMGTRNE